MVSNRPVKRNIFTHSPFGTKDRFSNRQFLSNLARLETGLIPRGISKFQNSNRQFSRRGVFPVDTRTNWLRVGQVVSLSAPGFSRVCLRRRKRRGAPTALGGFFGFGDPALPGWASFVPRRWRRWFCVFFRGSELQLRHKQPSAQGASAPEECFALRKAHSGRHTRLKAGCRQAESLSHES
jgi:hypothetical protein